MMELFGIPVKLVDREPTGNTDDILEVKLIDPAEYIGGSQCTLVGGPFDGMTWIIRNAPNALKFPSESPVSTWTYAKYCRVDKVTIQLRRI